MKEAKRLLTCIGEISDIFLEEAETAMFELSKRKKIAKYGALAAAAAFGLALTYRYVKKRSSARIAQAKTA
ncbi:MAG: hypothetical protein FWB80_05665 [Defluviitaleaceae bacterium]|nr:hypothetical protein [Defluviitaleaceae bacterium]